MNFLTLLLPTGATASTGPGSKTGSGEAAAGFEQVLFGLLGAVPQAAGGQVQTTTGQIGAVANTATASATAALLNGAQAAATAAQTVAAPVGLVEAAAKAATAGVAAAQTATGEAGKAAGKATGAVSEALLKNGLPTALPQQQTTVPADTTTTANTTLAQAAANAAQTVEQTTQQVVTTVEGAAKTATTTAEQAASAAAKAAAAAQKTAKAAETAIQKTVAAASDAVSKAAHTPAAAASEIAVDAVNKAQGAPAAAASTVATGAQASTAAAATGVATTTVKPANVSADGAGDSTKKPEATPASLITSTPEVTTAKDTIKSAVIQAPGADAGKQGATSGKEKDANSNAAHLRASRTAAPLAGDTVAQRAQAAAAQAAQHPSATPTTNASKPVEGFSQQFSAHSTGTVDATPILGTGQPGTPQGIDSTGAANAAARHGAAAFTPPAHQVALQFSRALATGSDHITIRLEPASLGRVDVKVELTKDGHLRALFTADRPDTLDMLQRDARVLERALNDAGLRADSSGLSFNLRGDGGGELPQFASQSGGSGTFSLGGTAGDNGDVAPAARQAALNANALLDIRV
jgi:flagellar hook-length control protein FliK